MNIVLMTLVGMLSILPSADVSDTACKLKVRLASQTGQDVAKLSSYKLYRLRHHPVWDAGRK